MHVTFSSKRNCFSRTSNESIEHIDRRIDNMIVMKPVLTEAKQQIFKFENTDSTLLIWDGESTTVTRA